MRRISGRCQRGIRYALWTLGEATTMEILEYCYPWPGEDRRQRKEPSASCVPRGQEDGDRRRPDMAWRQPWRLKD